MKTADTNPKQVDQTYGSICNKQPNIVLEPVFTYIWYATQNSAIENIKSAANGHFSIEAITAAIKDKLWTLSETDIIGEKVKRKGTTNRNEKETNVSDIISALSKLSKTEHMPILAVDAVSM